MINAYYEYSIDVKPNPIVGQNYITDSQVPVTLPMVRLADSRWIQFKYLQPENTIGNISDFRSIRFMKDVYDRF
jgi:cell surface protein SprA